jgi:hypothetical protein
MEIKFLLRRYCCYVFSGLYLVLAKANKIVFLSSNYSVKPIQFTKPKKNHEKLVLSFDPLCSTAAFAQEKSDSFGGNENASFNS